MVESGELVLQVKDKVAEAIIAPGFQAGQHLVLVNPVGIIGDRLEFLPLDTKQPVIRAVTGGNQLAEIGLTVDLQCGIVQIAEVFTVTDLGVIDAGLPAFADTPQVIQVDQPAIFALEIPCIEYFVRVVIAVIATVIVRQKGAAQDGVG